MANEKFLGTGKIGTGETAYVIVQYLWIENIYLNDADGSLSTSPADPYVSLTEHGVAKGFYELWESRDVWGQGMYRAYFYIQAGGSPSPVADALADVQEFFVVGDQIAQDFPFEMGGVEADAGNGVNSFLTWLTNTTDNYCVGSFLKFASGALANQVRKISAYNGSSKVITVSAGFTAVPSADDEFYIINQ
jgi:hypothetical protein